MTKQLSQSCLLISHGFNMDGRAASLTVTDKIPFLLDAGVKPIVLSAITGHQDHELEHCHLILDIGSLKNMGEGLFIK